MRKIFFSIVMLLMTGAAFAQDSTGTAELDAMVEMLRSDINTQKVAVINEVLRFTDAESTAFWPIYRQYDLELSKIGDQRLALIKDFAKNYENMTDDKAKELAKGILDLQEKRVKLKKKYFNKIDKVLPSIKAVQFLQLENRIEMLIDLQIAAEVPIIEKF